MKYIYLCGMKFSIKLTIIFAALLMCCMPADAQSKKSKKKEGKINIIGHALNSFTKAGVEAKVYLLREDSTLVDTTRCWYQGNDSEYFFEVPAVPAKYIIKAEHKDYHTTYVNYEVKNIARNSIFLAPWHYMKKKNPQEDLMQMVDEVQVVASKIKILHKGDTLVFNADAFNVPSGSMLDDLIKQLPGVELKKDGEILVNGRKVDELLLNGNKFVNGDNKLMLENLPYYVVKDIAVYEDSTEMDKWRGKQTEKKEYVMNVRMKKEFQGGYVGRIDLAGGTQERYMERLFGMRFDDHNRLIIFGNMNNTGNQGTAYGEGEWSEWANKVGEHTFKKANVNWIKDAKDKSFHEELSGSVEWQKNNEEGRTASEQFLTGGDVYNRNANTSESHNFIVNFDNRFQTTNEPKKYGMFTTFSFNYAKADYSSLAKSAQLSKKPEWLSDVSETLDSVFAANYGSQLYNMIVNRTFNQSKNKVENLQFNGNISTWKILPWGDTWNFEIDGSYGKQSVGDGFSFDRTEQLQTHNTDFRNNFTPAPSQNYNFSIRNSYDIDFLNGFDISGNITYQQNYNNTTNEHYRLDQLGRGWDADSNTHILGQLPSTRDSLLMALDISNSKWHDNLQRQWSEGIRLMYYVNNDSTRQYFVATANVTQTSEWMKFHSKDLNEKKERNNVLPNGSVNYSYTKMQRDSVKNIIGYNELGFNYNFNVNRPEFTQLYDIFDNTNLLSQRLSNPNLKNSRTHNFNIRLDISEYKKKNKSLNLNFSASLSQNQWGSKTTYNKTTGVYTYQPDNVNGNWTARSMAHYSQNLDSALHWFMSHEISYDFNHSVDFDICEIDGQQQVVNDKLSKVNNGNLGYSCALAYTYSDLSIRAKGSFDWRHSTSKKENFETINAFEFNYGIEGEYTIPWLKLQLQTELNVYSRRGYQQEGMNKDDIMWNLAISRSFLKGDKLTLKLAAQDILNQQSSTQMSVNAQGRTESWNRMVPNYVLLHAIYRFDLFKKKKD